MELVTPVTSTCWQLKISQKLLKRIENVSAEFRITEKKSQHGSEKVVQIIVDDELSRVAKALHCLHQHKIADNIQTCPESIAHVDLSYLSTGDRAAVRESHKNITWQRSLFRARQNLQLSGLILPAVDGAEPSLWPSVHTLFHRMLLKLHMVYNSRNINPEILEWAGCVQESERSLSGLFDINQMSDPGTKNPSWLVRNNVAERCVKKRLTVHTQTHYYGLSEIPVTEMGHRRVELLVENILHQTSERIDTEVSEFCGAKLLKETLLSLFPLEDPNGNQFSQEYLWERLQAANFTYLAPAFEAILSPDSPLARRRLLQFLCSTSVRGSIYNKDASDGETEHVYRSQKISLSPGVYFIFVCFSDHFKTENITLKGIGNVIGLAYGPSIAMSDLDELYHEENLLRSIHLKQYYGDKEKLFRADQRFFIEKYNLHRYHKNSFWESGQVTYSTPFIIPEDKCFDTIDLSPAMLGGIKAPRKRRKHLLKHSLDDRTMQDVLVKKFQGTKTVTLQEHEIFNHLGDSPRVRAIMDKVAIIGQNNGRVKSWVLRREFAKE